MELYNQEIRRKTITAADTAAENRTLQRATETKQLIWKKLTTKRCQLSIHGV